MVTSTRLLSLLVLALCLSLPGCGGDDDTGSAGPPVAAELFGINAQRLQALPTIGRLDALELQLDSVAELGVAFVRANLDWRITEPSPHGAAGYDWATTDEWVAALARHGLRWQVTGQGAPTPSWAVEPAALAAGCGSGSPPARPRDFAALMSAVADRYGSDGKFWELHAELSPRPITAYEIWNEPNFGRFWCPAPDPGAYARLYVTAADAIHAADPDAVVVLGGLAAFRQTEGANAFRMAADEFLRRVVDEQPGLADRVDAVGVHPYGPTPADVLDTLAWFRRTLDSVGLEGVPMSANEVGWVTSGEAAIRVSEEQRAAYVAAALPSLVRSGCELSAVALHTWITPEMNLADAEDWYGVADPATAAPYPTASSYAEAVKALVAGDPVPVADDVDVPAGVTCDRAG